MFQAEKASQSRREEKAGRRPGQDGLDPQDGVQHASQKGRDQRRRRGDLVYRRVALEQQAFLQHLGDAGLNRGRLKSA